MKDIEINGTKIDLSDRKLVCETFGKQIKPSGGADYYIRMCDKRIESYEAYIANLKELKRIKLDESVTQRREELKSLLLSMSENERNEFINNLK